MEITPEQLHEWYMEATGNLDPHFFNLKAQVPYEQLHEKQKFIDKYIADKINASHNMEEPTTEFNPQSMDAKIWAKEFMRLYKNSQLAPINTPIWLDEELMISWFANAIMAGYDEANRRRDNPIDECPECQGFGGTDVKPYCKECDNTGKVAKKPFPEDLVRGVLERLHDTAYALGMGSSMEALRADNPITTDDALSEIQKLMEG